VSSRSTLVGVPLSDYGARDGGDAVARGQIGEQIDQESRSTISEPHLGFIAMDSTRYSTVDRHTLEEATMGPTIRSMVIPVSDLDAAKAIYTALLGAPHTDQPYYVGYNVEGFEVALAPSDGAGGPVVNADVEDLDAIRATLLAAGATERSAPRQVAPEARVCVLADADGNPIGLRGR
jgi:predicted enzyme related to lactoylglutathione lyase